MTVPVPLPPSRHQRLCSPTGGGNLRGLLNVPSVVTNRPRQKCVAGSTLSYEIGYDRSVFGTLTGARLSPGAFVVRSR